MGEPENNEAEPQLLPVGTRIRALVAQFDCDENDQPRAAPPGSYGTIDQLYTYQSECYSVAFDCGVCGFWSPEEMARDAEVVLLGMEPIERPVGQYWIVTLPSIRRGRTPVPQVSYYDGEDWWLQGNGMPWPYDSVVVLSALLAMPAFGAAPAGQVQP